MAYSDTFQIRNSPATDADIVGLLAACGSPLPPAYLQFLRLNNGTDGAFREVCRVALRLYSVEECVRRNVRYRIQHWEPALWMIGDDSGDYGYCFDRSAEAIPDYWPVVECPLGDVHRSQLALVARSFDEWQRSLFVVKVHEI